jgi:hypothetical protein
MKSKLIATFFVLFLGALSNVYAAMDWVQGARVDKVLSQSDSGYAGCMVHINIDHPTLDCPGRWYHMDCVNNPEYGKRTYASVLTAMMGRMRVSILADDSQKVNSYCKAYRIDVYR